MPTVRPGPLDPLISRWFLWLYKTIQGSQGWKRFIFIPGSKVALVSPVLGPVACMSLHTAS